jgi:hypothetical protein
VKAPTTQPRPMSRTPHGFGALALVVVGSILLASSARAQAPAPDPARLEYRRAADVAATCPPEAFFRNEVAGHLGVDPFTADAPKRIKVSLDHRAGAFSARLELFDQASGERVGDPEVRVDRNCDSLVEEAARHVANAWLVPLVLVRPAPTPVPVPPRAEPAPEPRALALQPAPKPALVELPTRIPKPGVFEGRAGFVRALLCGATAGSLASGATFAAVSTSKGNEARQLGGALVQKLGGTPCYRTSELVAGPCQQVGKLVQQEDDATRATIGLLAASGVLGAAAIASIWINRTPTTPAVQVKAMAPGARAGLTIAGTW